MLYRRSQAIFTSGRKINRHMAGLKREASARRRLAGGYLLLSDPERDGRSNKVVAGKLPALPTLNGVPSLLCNPDFFG